MNNSLFEKFTQVVSTFHLNTFMIFIEIPIPYASNLVDSNGFYLMIQDNDSSIVNDT